MVIDMAVQESRLVISIDARNAEREAAKLDTQLQKITKSGDAADKQVNVLSASLKTLAGYMAGIVTVSTAINKIDAYTNLQNRLRLVTQSQKELNQATSDTFAIAQKTYQSWDSVVQVYQRFSDNAKTLGINMQKTAELTETVSKAVAISGASTEAAEAALMQFGQALASGVLRGEELNSVMEQTPALAKAIANGMGITIGQLREVAAEGQITSDVLIKALTNASQKVSDDFDKTNMTIGQSFTYLDNELTKFAANANSAGGLISESIKAIASNLELISSAAIVAGIGYVTAAIAGKTTVITANVTAMIAQRTAAIAQAKQEVVLATAVTNEAKAHLALVQATTASTQAKFGATAASIKYKQATDAVTAALAQQAAAERAAATASATTIKAGSTLLSVLGGPVGIGVTVASIAAGYLLMRNSTAQANEKLQEQAKIADQTAEELQKLEGAQKAAARKDLEEAFAAQNEELAKRGRIVNNTIASISSMNTADAETARILREVRTGVLSYDDAFKALNKSKTASPDIIKRLRDEINKYEEARVQAQKNADAQKALGKEVELSGNKAQNAVKGINSNTEALDKNAAAASAASKAHMDYNKKLQTDAFEAIYKEGLLKKYTIEQADAIFELQKAKGFSAILSDEEINNTLRTLATTEKLKERQDAITEAKRQQNKESEKARKEAEKQQKILQVNAKVMQLSSKYAISAKAAAAGIPEGVIEAMIMQESRGDTYRNGKLLTSKAGAQGLGQFMPGTAKQYGVDVRSEESSIKGMIKYMSDLIKQFGGDIDKAIMAYNAGPGNVRSGKAYGFKETQGYLKNVKAYAAGVTGFAGEAKDFDSILKESNALLTEQANMRKQLELEVADRITQIRSNLADRLQEIDEANFTPEKAAELKSKYEYQANTEIAIYKQSLVTKLNEYEAFQKSEFKLLEESFNEKKFYAAIDSELTKTERQKALQLLDKQYKLEFMKLDLAKQQRIHAVREQFMDETTAMQERYRLERAEIEFTNNESERAALMQLSHLKEREEIMKRLKEAQAGWNNTQTSMLGFGGEEQQIWDTQFSRTEASSELFNSQLAGAGSLEEREALHQAHQDRLTEIERNANQARLDLNMSYGEQIMGSMSSIAKDMLGEQSATYKALFAVEKGFAMARATLNFTSAYASAFNDPTALTTAQKFANYAALAAAGSQIIGTLASIKATGFANGGYTGNGSKHEVAGLVHKGEVVFSQADVKNAGGVQAVENLRKYGKGLGGVSVSIENYGTSKDFEVQQIDENQIRIIARDEAQKTVVSDLRNPNSKISSTLKQTKNVVERR